MKKLIELGVFIVALLVFIFVGWTKLSVIYYNQGLVYYNRAQYDAAIVRFQKAVNFNPKSALLHYALANTYALKKMDQEAIKEYKKTLEIDPHYNKAYRALGEIYFNSNMYEEVISLLKSAQERGVSGPEIRELLRSNNFAYAAEYLNNGVTAFMKGDKKEAYALLKKAIALNQDFAYSYYILGYFYYVDGEYPQAIDNLQQAIKIQPKFWIAYRLLANLYFAQGEQEEALKYYKDALALNNQDAFAYNDLGLALVKMERYSEAILYLKEAAKLAPNNADIHYSLACTLRDNRMFNEALAEYKYVLNLKPDYPNIYNDFGDIYYNQNRIDDAQEQYRKQIDICQKRLILNPKDAVTLNMLAWAYNGIKEYDQAEDAARKAVSLKPGYRQAYLTLANIQENRKDFQGALGNLNKAQSISEPLGFISQDINEVKNRVGQLIEPDEIHLKNGRLLKGRIEEETPEKIIIEVYGSSSVGKITLDRDSIEWIKKSAGPD